LPTIPSRAHTTYAVAAALTAATLAGCGSGGSARSPDLSKLPLVPGARIVSQARTCDKGANAFCDIELVVVAPSYKTSAELLTSEHAELRKSGWTGAEGDFGGQHAADSPGHKLHVTYALPYTDLGAYDFDYIKRSPTIARALAHLAFPGTPAMSVLLEIGSG
jgi:hypothetical protein